MKKFNKLLSLVLCLSMLCSSLVVLPISADNTTEYKEIIALDENFESASVGSTPADWDTSSLVNANGKSKISVEQTTVAAAANKALHLKHADTSVPNVRASYKFDQTNNVSLSFDYMYDAMSPAVNDSGLLICLNNNGKIVQCLYIQKAVSGNDSAAKVGYLTQTSTPAIFNSLQKGKWYHFELNSYNLSSGSVMDMRIFCDGVIVFSVSIPFTSLTVNSFDIVNSSARDNDESHYLDNLSLKAGNHVYSDDFDGAQNGAAVDPQKWTVSGPAAAYDMSKVYVKTEEVVGVGYEYTANRAAQLFHKQEVANITATHTFASASNTATLSFDWLYESMTTGTTGKGGMSVQLKNNGTLSHALLVEKNSASDDSAAKLSYRDGGWKSTGFTGLRKGYWHHFDLKIADNKLEIKISINGETVFEQSFACSTSASFNQILFTNYGHDLNDVHWFDNFKINAGSYSFEDKFDTDLSSWTVSQVANSDSTRVFIKTGEMEVAKVKKETVEYTNALYVEDGNGGGMPRAGYTFAKSKTVTVEFDYKIVSPDDYCAFVFGLYDGGSAPASSKGYFGVWDNKNGTATLKYYKGGGTGWVNTSANALKENTWYKVRLEVKEGSNIVTTYIDGVKVCDAEIKTGVSDVSLFEIGSAGTNEYGEKVFVDNVKISTLIPKLKNEFEHPLDEAVASGEFSFSVKTSALDKTTQMALTSGGKEKIHLRVREDGALEYRRPTLWEDTWLLVNTMLPAEDGTKYPKGAVKADEWVDITLRLPYDRNNNYVMVYVNGEYVGNALYAGNFTTVDTIKVICEDNDATLDAKNFRYAADTEGVIKAPERTQKDAVSYLPLVIEGSRAMYLEGDNKPARGAMAYAESATAVQFNKQYNSIGVDLGTKQQVNALRITTEAPDEATVTSLSSEGYKVYVSDDNLNYTYVGGQVYNHFLENGKWTVLVEFSGVEARFVKLGYSASKGSENAITVYPKNNVRPEAKIIREYKLAGEFVEAVGIDAEPLCTPLLRNYNTAEEITLTTGMSIGLNMGIACFVESVELVGTGLSELDKNAFKVYASNDNCVYTPIEDVILSRGVRDGKDVYRLSFDAVECVYIKLHAVSENTNVQLDTRKDGFAAYSSKEASSTLNRFSRYRSGEGDYYTLPDGTMIMLSIAFSADGHDYSNYQVNAMSSVDGGKTWSEPWVYLALPTYANTPEYKDTLSVSMAKVFHVDGEPGHMKMVYRIIFTRNDDRGYACEYYFVESFDYGRNWENPQPIIHDIYPDTFGGGSSGNQITRLSNGRIIYSNSIYKYQKDDYGAAINFRQFISGYVYYSDDEGKTWTRSDSTIIMPSNCDETSVAELDNGDLLLTIRTRDANGVYQSISTDSGVTWSQPVAVEGMDSPSSTNTVKTIPATGDVLLIWNNQEYDYSNINGTRNPLTMSVTADHGLTYHNFRNLYEFGASWANIYFYGRNLVVQTGALHSVMDVALLYHTVEGTKTVADLPKAATPTATYADGVLSEVTSTMTYSTDGGSTWRFCGGALVEIGEGYEEILVKDIGTHEYAPSDIQTVK